MESLSSMQAFLSSRPKCFRSLEHAIEWWYVLCLSVCLSQCMYCSLHMCVFGVCVVCMYQYVLCVCVSAVQNRLAYPQLVTSTIIEEICYIST